MDLRDAVRLLYAATTIGIGIGGFVAATFPAILQPAPADLPSEQLFVSLSAAILIACGLGLLWSRTIKSAALSLLILFSVWTAIFKFAVILRHPLIEGAYQSCGENLAYLAGAWILYCWANADDHSQMGPSGEIGIASARVVFALAMLAFGFSHFVYVELTTPLIPAWLGAPTFWAYFTGGAYVAAGVAILAGVLARLAAVAVAVQISLITLLVWGPMVVAGGMSAAHWQETIVSSAITAGSWVVAASFSGSDWLGRARLGSASALAAHVVSGGQPMLEEKAGPH